MPKPSRPVLLFSSAVVILMVLPVVLAGLALARVVFIPPVSGARFIGYDGLHFDTTCEDSPAAKGGQVLICNGYYHIDSRFEVINHDYAAVCWCIQRIDDWHFNQQPSKHFGPLSFGSYPPIPPDWGGCTEM